MKTLELRCRFVSVRRVCAGRLSNARTRLLLLGIGFLAAALAGQGSTIDFNGAGQYLRANPNNLLLRSNATFEAWVKPRTSRCNTIVSRGNGNSGTTDYIFQLGYCAGACNTRLLSFYGAGGWDSSASPVPLNEWTHVAVTFDGTEKRIYINGVLDATASRPGQPQ